MTQAMVERAFDPATVTDEHLRALTRAERNHLAGRLAALDLSTSATSATGEVSATSATSAIETASLSSRPTRTWWLHLPAVIALGAFLAMIPWTATLAATLPDRYVITHWSTTWVGFDTLLAVSFAITAWATWKRRPVRLVACVITATLLACDAWFDMTTASTSADFLVSTISAVVGELPLAGLLLWLGIRGRRHAPVPARS
jgi:hypothetical protein